MPSEHRGLARNLGPACPKAWRECRGRKCSVTAWALTRAHRIHSVPRSTAHVAAKVSIQETAAKKPVIAAPFDAVEVIRELGQLHGSWQPGGAELIASAAVIEHLLLGAEHHRLVQSLAENSAAGISRCGLNAADAQGRTAHLTLRCISRGRVVLYL